jgi:hypothetical protein
MTERFEVGEIAVIGGLSHTDWSWANGVEVTIMSALVDTPFGPLHEIESQELRARLRGARIFFWPQFLRKRRPPPDWNAIAGTRELETA